jgi:hypothetical protein
LDHRAAQVRPVQVRAAQVRHLQVRVAQVRSPQVRAGQDSANRVGGGASAARPVPVGVRETAEHRQHGLQVRRAHLQGRQLAQLVGSEIGVALAGQTRRPGAVLAHVGTQHLHTVGRSVAESRAMRSSA